MRLLQIHNGQALVELAVFGAFFLMLLGVLLSYGIKYNFQQKAQMTAFRRALKIASDQDRGTGSAMVMEDRAIPDPSTMFDIGSTAPVVASASVQRDYMMHAQPVDGDSLQGSVMDIQTSRNVDTNGNVATGTQEWMRRIYKTAAFRVEYLVLKANLDKYEQIYGSLLALKTGSLIGDPDPWVSTSSSDADMACLASHDVTDADGNTTTVCDSEAYAAIRIIDACSGEISDYDTCYSQARQLVDPAFCARKCELAKIPGSTTDCTAVCNLLTNSPNQTVKTYDSTMGGAWYAADWEAPSPVVTAPYTQINPNYNFPYLSGYRGNGTIVPALFSFSGARSPSDPVKQMAMGLQSDMTQNTQRSESIDRTETTSAISTQEDAVWTDTLNRQYVHQANVAPDGFENVPASGQPGDFVNVTTDNVTSEVAGSVSRAKQTVK
ncbi:MAG: hypothetical protein V1840_02690 [Candidatus Omnitrophota bacterium]